MAEEGENEKEVIECNNQTNMNKYEELISKVSKDIDKKSVYSKKMQNKFQQNQQKQALKNRNLLKNNTT